LNHGEGLDINPMEKVDCGASWKEKGGEKVGQRNGYNISRLLVEIRTGRHLIRRQMAAKLDCSPNYVYMIESGLRLPSLSITLKLETFGYNPLWLKSLWVRDYMTYQKSRILNKLDLESCERG